MRRGMVIVLAVVLVGAAAACSSGDDDGSPTSTTGASTDTTSAGGTTYTGAELEGALLQPSQLPPGWAVASPPSTQDSDPATKNDLLCPAGIATWDDAAVATGNPQAQATYQSSPLQLLASIEAVPPGRAQAVVGSVVDALAACNGQTWTSDGITWTSVLPVSPPAPGAAASHLVGSGSAGPTAVDVMAIPVDDRDVVIELVLVQPGDAGLDQATLDQLVRDAIANAQAL